MLLCRSSKACGSCLLLILLLPAGAAGPNQVVYWGDLSFGATDALSSAQPVPLPGALPFVELAAGRTHACGLLANGSAYCIGDNARGALGVGANIPRSMVPLPVDSNRTFSALAAGWEFSCAQAPNADLWCWGRNDFGQLCDGTTQDKPTPVRSAAAFLLAGTTAGALHACGINGSSAGNGGPGICWGSNQLGQLTAEGINPPGFMPDQNGSAVSTSGALVAGGKLYVELAAGGYHTCGRTAPAAGAETFCWGSNEKYQTGNSFTSSRAAMLPVKVDYGDRQFTQLTAGALHTCGLENGTHKAWCWGSNAEGQLGWSGYDSKRPVEVSGGHQWRQLSAGGLHTCGITVDNGTWCWGSNSAGQLGSGQAAPALPNSTAPLKVVGGNNFSQVVASWDTTYGIIGNDTLQLNRPPSDATSSGPPVQINSGSFAVGAVVGIAAAVVITLAVLALFVWRRHKKRRRRLKPVPVDGVAAAGSKLVSSAPSTALALHGSGGPGSSTSDRCSDHLSSDPVLSYIASRLASGKQRSGLTGSSQSPLMGAGSSGSAGSGNIPRLAEWQVDWNSIKLERQIGRGAYGRVYSGHWSGIQVAVKVLITKESFEDELEGEGLQLPESVQKELQVEAVTLSRLRHPCCVTFYGICELPPAILTEYCVRGSLYDVLQAARRQPAVAAQLTWQRRLSLAYDAAVGLGYLHNRSPPILHRDVKSPNLLVDSHWRCKVADFNLSKILAGGQQPVASSGGAPLNPTWLAPEVLAGEQATMASDAFSFGYVLWELLTWRLPWSGVQPFVVMKLVRSGSRPDIPPLDQLPGPSPAGCPGMEDYMQLIRDCWAQDPAQRPGFASIAPRLHALLEQLGYGAAEV